MDESLGLLTLFYVIFTLCFVLRTSEFISLGLTVESIFSKIVGRDVDNFVFYQIRRSSCTLFIHSSLLLGYRLCLSWVANYPVVDKGFSLLNVLGTLSLMLPITTSIIIYQWKKDNWENHPIAKRLTLFCDDNSSWRTLASDINIEFRRIDKIAVRCSSLVEVLVTDNWIIKLSPYSMELAHQSDTTLTVDTADTHTLAATGSGTAQFLNIKASFTRRGNHHFYIRLNALDFKDLEDKLHRPVVVAQNIIFHRSKADQFLEVFKEHVYQNPYYHPTEEVEKCVGCFVNSSNVKLMKNCTEEGPNPCRNCYCRPMWCVGCMGRWFASRQEEEHPEDWLSSKCTCPVCRSVFCILDVSPIEESANSDETP
uniref:Uncharacterized protein n=1 Tax=Graphocephala atropunctata TaxID=36148 RepID=A0A1B6LAU6_9HEMI